MSPIIQSAINCINPDCKRPYPQPWGNKFCNSCGAPLQLLNRYVPLQPLGAGGFAQIYTVWDTKTQAEKVLKVLVAEAPKALELFQQEAAVLSRLRHSGVPQVDADGYFQLNLPNPQRRQIPCLVMEKIDGKTLEEISRKYPQGCPEDLVLSWFAQAVQILQELHKRQIIHRDIKPSNLMLRTSSVATSVRREINSDQLVLIDFGGAKQFSTAMGRSPSSSTRLYSSGYSPPEQITGGYVGPTVDFYALGRTMIELLTGKCPPDLEDPQTGMLQWRRWVNINPQFADLLDDMTQEDVRSRPANATIIQKRLVKIVRGATPPELLTWLQNWVNQAVVQLTPLEQVIKKALLKFSQAAGRTSLLIIKAIAKFLLACLATIWAMILTGISASIGTIAGFILAYKTTLGVRVAHLLLGQLPDLIPQTEPMLGAEIVMFAAAGLGTAWGLTIAGVFGQKRRFLVAPIMGIISYSLGWLALLLTTTRNSNEGLVISILFAIFLFALSLGLRSHHIVYAIMASLGTSVIFAALIRLELLPVIFQFSSQPEWIELYLPVAFFGFAGILLSFWLGISYYLIVPGLRLLGWR
ncbi:serine/threonine protein kinase [Fortiea contorta]|uniref:serine/threonine protein kinase n=1 Tax=Fortiea contorta TaxID=1892405 RepID=UPI00034B9979|nr:serine/threonine-protein kinase [Fortiea contorta]